MADLNVPGLDRTVQETDKWLKEIGASMGVEERRIAYHALRGVLFAIRDRLEPNETFHLAAQLPLLVRGIFFEGYKPAGKPEKFRHRQEFLERVNRELEPVGYSEAETATHAVLDLLNRRITEGEMEEVRHMLPEEIRELWP